MQASHGQSYKEAMFLYIPTIWASLYQRCTECQRIACISRLVQRISFSMFYHRVLPPPSNLATPSTTGLRPPKRDALLENRIMTNEDTSPYIDQRDFQGHLPKSSTGNEKEARGRAGVPDENPSPTGVLTRSSTRLLQKHASSRSPISENRRLSRVDPSLAATEGESSRPVESPSQVCLCQPDPKVPRPRNGMYLHVIV